MDIKAAPSTFNATYATGQETSATGRDKQERDAFYEVDQEMSANFDWDRPIAPLFNALSRSISYHRLNGGAPIPVELACAFIAYCDVQEKLRKAQQAQRARQVRDQEHLDRFAQWLKQMNASI